MSNGANWEDYFLPGEQLVWEGAPVPGFHSLPMQIFMTLFGVPFFAAGAGLTFGGLFFAFQGKSMTDSGGSLLAAVFGMPFLAVGVFLVFGQWVIAALAPRRVRYALSTRAGYIAKRYWGREMSIYPILPISGFELKEGRLAQSVWFHSRKEEDSEGSMLTHRAGFENIADGYKVLGLLRQVQSARTPAPTFPFHDTEIEPR